MTQPEDPRRLICRCIGVSSTRILECVREKGLTTVEEVGQALLAGTGCSTCQPEIEELLAGEAGTPVDAQERLENRLICQTETLCRIEGSLESTVEPKLQELGISIEEVEASGLDITIRLSGPVDDETIEMIQGKLHKLVCADLSIKIL
jgi:NAD(P)H-nitrite reductase large subunit